MNFAEYVALLSGNQDLMDKVKLEKRAADITRSYTAFTNQKSEAEYSYARIKKDKVDALASIERLKKDYSRIEHIDLEKARIVVEGKSFEDRKDLGEHLIKAVKALDTNRYLRERVTLASLGEFNLRYERSVLNINGRVIVESPEGLVYNYADGQLNENPALAGRFIIDAIKRIPKVIESTQERIISYDAKITTYEKVLSEVFPELAELKGIQLKIDALTSKIETAAVEKEKQSMEAKSKGGDAGNEITM